MRNFLSSYCDVLVIVSFFVLKKVVSKFCILVIFKDWRFLDFGVFVVQINEGESIVFGIKLGRQRFKVMEVDFNKLWGSLFVG